MFQEFSLFSPSLSQLLPPPRREKKKGKDILLVFGKIGWENLTEKRNSDRTLNSVCVCKTIYKTSKELNLVWASEMICLFLYHLVS